MYTLTYALEALVFGALFKKFQYLVIFCHYSCICYLDLSQLIEQKTKGIQISLFHKMQLLKWLFLNKNM